MEEQSSIFLQKKMILTLFTIIFTIMSGIYVATNNFRNYQNLTVVSGNEVIESNTIFYEDDIVTIEQIAYAAVTEISEGDVLVNENEANEKIHVARFERIPEGETVSRKETREETISKKAETLGETTTEDVGEIEEATVAEVKQTEETVANDDSANKPENAENANATTNQDATQNVAENKKENTTNYVSYRELAEDNPPAEYDSVVEVSATAYCLCKKCCGKSPSHPSYGMTASGLKIVPGTGVKVIAVDPALIPLGTKVYVEGLNGAWDYGYATASDTGSAIKNHKIDLYMDTHTEALSWGRRNVKVYLIEK